MKNIIEASEFIEIKKELSNQKKHDKFSLGYYIKNCESDSIKGLYWDTYKRSELLEYLLGLLEESPKALSSLCAMQSFSKYKDWVNSIPCILKNSRNGKILVGTYAECYLRKNKNNSNRACYSLTKNWVIKYAPFKEAKEEENELFDTMEDVQNKIHELTNGQYSILPARDGANLIANVTYEFDGEVIIIRIYKTFDEKLNPKFSFKI